MEYVYQIEERHGLLLLHRHQHDVIDAEKLAFEHLVVGTHCRCGRVLHPQDIDEIVHRDELGLVSFHHGVPYETGRHEGLSGSGRSHEYDVVVLVEPDKFPELLQLRPGDACAVERCRTMSPELDGFTSEDGSHRIGTSHDGACLDIERRVYLYSIEHLSGHWAEPWTSFYADGFEEEVPCVHCLGYLRIVISSTPRSEANAAIFSKSGRIFATPMLSEGDAGSFIVRSIMKNFLTEANADGLPDSQGRGGN